MDPRRPTKTVYIPNLRNLRNLCTNSTCETCEVYVLIYHDVLSTPEVLEPLIGRGVDAGLLANQEVAESRGDA